VQKEQTLQTLKQILRTALLYKNCYAISYASSGYVRQNTTSQAVWSRNESPWSVTVKLAGLRCAPHAYRLCYYRQLVEYKSVQLEQEEKLNGNAWFTSIKGKGKGKVISLQARCGPVGG